MLVCNHGKRRTIESLGGDPLVEVCATCTVRFFRCGTCNEPRPEGACAGVCRHCMGRTGCVTVARCDSCVEATCAWHACGKTFIKEKGGKRKYCGTPCRAAARKDREAQRRAAANTA